MSKEADTRAGVPAKPLKPAPDCHLYVIDREGVLFCEGQQELHALNTTATFVWLCLEDGKDETATAQDLADSFQVSSAETEPAVRGLLDDWRKRGLLEGWEHERPPLTRPPGEDLGPFPNPPVGPPTYASRVYRMLDTALTIHYGTAEHEEWIHPILSHLESNAPALHQADYRLVDLENGVLLLHAGSPIYLSPHLAMAGPTVKGFFLSLALNNFAYLLQIHAGVVEKEGECLLLPALPGSGKSSLTAGLLHAGWRYLSDETAPVAADTLNVRPLPLALAAKSGAWPLLQRRFPEMKDLRSHLREDGKLVRYLVPPPRSLAPDLEAGYAVRWIVFPSYQPGVESQLEPLSTVETLGRLLAENLSLPRHLDCPTVEKVLDWIGKVQGYALPNSDLGRAVDLIESLRRSSS